MYITQYFTTGIYVFAGIVFFLGAVAGFSSAADPADDETVFGATVFTGLMSLVCAIIGWIFVMGNPNPAWDPYLYGPDLGTWFLGAIGGFAIPWAGYIAGGALCVVPMGVASTVRFIFHKNMELSVLGALVGFVVPWFGYDAGWFLCTVLAIAGAVIGYFLRKITSRTPKVQNIL